MSTSPSSSSGPRRRRIGRALGLALVVLTGTFALLELLYRAALFSDAAAFASLRDAGEYADFSSEDDYWKLYWRFGGRFRPAANPHPVLGWTGPFDRETWRHDDADALVGRRPVLLYGDSFAGCVEQALCFQDHLNPDPEFSADHLLLNHGVGGYGLDQIWLLLDGTVDQYDDPFVVVSLMTFDLDRSVLSVRTGQKPRLRLEEGELVREAIPIAPDPNAWYEQHPPRIVSYVWRRFLRSRFAPRALVRLATGEAARIERKRALNERILEAIVERLRARDLEFVLLVFHHRIRGLDGEPAEPDWRDELLAEFAREHGVELWWADDIALAGSPVEDPGQATFHVPGDGHPNSLFNGLVAEAIKRKVMESRR